jgi:lysophospholipase L1-like esterase
MILRVAWSRTVRGLALGVGAVSGALFTLGLVVVLAELKNRNLARAMQPIEEPRAVGTFGSEHEGEPLGLAMLGDSLAVGIGADAREHTVGALLAESLARRSGRPVALSNTGRSGADSGDLAAQVREVLAADQHADVAVIIIGGNDVMHRNDATVAARQLYRAVRDLRRSGSRVVVATCPDMGTVRALVQPLRYIAHRASRTLALAQTLVVLRGGGSAVPLGATLGPIFVRRPKQMFSTDHFHPSSAGYARAAAVLLPSVSAAALLGPV